MDQMEQRRKLIDELVERGRLPPVDLGSLYGADSDLPPLHPPPKSLPLRRSLRGELGRVFKAARLEFSLATLVIPERKVTEGLLIRSTSIIWAEVVRRLQQNWATAYEIPPDKWEEIVAGAYSKAGFDEVILTPRSGDHGRDVIAIRKGIGCIKVIGSVKAYKKDHLVSYDDVRALLGVMSGEHNTSKGIISTTSDFPAKIRTDPFIAPFLDTRLELMNGEVLLRWLAELLEKGGS